MDFILAVFWLKRGEEKKVDVGEGVNEGLA